jgi:hypothetical protein
MIVKTVIVFPLFLKGGTKDHDYKSFFENEQHRKIV